VSGLAALTLDAAGTLIEPREPVGTCYARVAAAHGLAVDAAVVGRRFRRALRAAPPLAFPGVAAEGRRDRETAWWRAVVRQALGPLARHSAFEACFAALYAHFAAPEAWATRAGAREALLALRAHGLALAVVSNFDGRLHAVLRGLHLAPLLDDVVVSTEHGAAKPDARLFHAVAARLGVPPGRVLHVGDDPIADVQGARGAGCRAALLTRDRRPPVPPGVAVLRSLRDLPRLVRGVPDGGRRQRARTESASAR
jgi:putative hydrolase of the HAD superfamily